MKLWEGISRTVAAASGLPFAISARHAAGGGCINAAWVIEGEGRRYFVKVNEAASLPMFEAEAEGLRELARAAAIRVPEPVCCGAAGGSAFLVLEHLSLGHGGTRAAARLGEQLACLHRVTAPQFGWRRANTIGATLQANDWTSDWLIFWRRHRLGFQLDLAARKGCPARLRDEGARLLETFPQLFQGYAPVPSLLHGDLWSGNAAYDESGMPVIFDPAVYYGDREADLAMTELFGGFPQDFYAAYRRNWPLDSGYAVRRTLYNLYHILNHFNLFGGGYAAQAESMIAALLAETR